MSHGNIRCQYEAILPIAECPAHPKNPNKHSQDQLAVYAAILAHQGVRQPVRISKQSGFVTKGHGQVLASKLNGWDQVPVEYQDYDSSEQEYADLVADNALARQAELDYSMVNAEMPDLGPDFDLSLLAIPDFQVEPADKGHVIGTEDDAPEPTINPRSKLGEVYLLGKHRLMCGDSTDLDQVRTLMRDDRAAMVFTDPPYNVGYEGNQWSSGKIKTGRPDWEGGIKNDKMDRRTFEVFMERVYAAIDSVINPGGGIYVCYPSGRDGWPFIKAWEKTEWHFQSTLVWLKSHLFISRWDYHPIYEPILYGWKEGAAHRFLGERNQSACLQHKSAIRQNEAGFHPTQKPVSLIEQCMKNSTERGEVLFEPFGGSGSTMIACEKNDRLCFTMELDPIYVDTILDRWAAYTGKDPMRLVDSKMWSEIKAE